ncbi:MAG: hypothetical protein IT381_26210 [Deltaproteobacteria bacterium]|nr:hypothetical protein [Deltaproteobacteria bacterium]
MWEEQCDLFIVGTHIAGYGALIPAGPPDWQWVLAGDVRDVVRFQQCRAEKSCEEHRLAAWSWPGARSFDLPNRDRGYCVAITEDGFIIAVGVIVTFS